MEENGKLITFACPQCGTEFELPAEYVGRDGKCTECGFIFVIQNKQKPAPSSEDDSSKTKEMDLPPQESSSPATTLPARGLVPQLQDDPFQVKSVQKPLDVTASGSFAKTEIPPAPAPKEKTEKKSLWNSLFFWKK